MTIAQLADELIDVLFDVAPLEASLLGFREREDKLTDYSEAGEAAADARLADVAARAEAVDPAGLDDAERTTRAVILQQVESQRDLLAVRGVEYTVTDSFFAPAPATLSFLPMTGITEPAHADGYLARLAGLPALLDAIAVRHRAGIVAGRLPVRRLAEATVEHFTRYLASPADDPLRRPEPAAGSGTDAAAFRAERDRLLAEVVHPAVGAYRDAVAADVVAHGRPDDRAGLCWLPGGDEFYAKATKVHTTTTRTPDELHQTGLDVLAGLTDEYAAVGERAFGTGELSEILQRLRTDPAMRWRDADELLRAARSAIRRAEQVAPQWFGRLPSQSCVVEAVPAAEAPGAPGAYYMQPAMDGSRPGTYYANTHDAEKRDRYSAESVAFHEGVPGHHFQLTIAQELTDLPLLRRLASITAFDEGWGLYAERLADEMGLYSDDIARLGMLSEDSMRACRLVVDTGLHAKGWSRQQAVDFMVANTATSRLEIETEVDRYISAPGQALAYMVGRLEIQRIRAAAAATVGDRFDLRAFHDVVLGNGPLPMSVLDDVVGAWAARQG
ncbi:DUF885 domain-containing protein [Jiangella alkaliphila]|uniref:Uncharacterized conserved protein, DUF885 familyt n=1 Tax=Jiangella alkaliphila TaxID=419479 RepID=A0A1H2HQG5_9ACTN|nr:DUF885 domain-containing protein [Jiangella alkaliphila]SDU34093.1 Uncharacterized conserved protein, DUF885 familyt [Jiangella alkaliphila]